LSNVHPIEAESYRILAGRVDLGGWPPRAAAVAARVVHATADPSLLPSLVVDESAVEAGVAALAAGAPVICDVEMVRAGITAPNPICLLAEVEASGAHPSRTAAAMARAADRHPHGAVVVVGCAPTALGEVNRRIAAGRLRPALVIGVPVGYVGAAEAKAELLAVAGRAGVPVISLRGERGGAAVAAAVLNAIVRLGQADRMPHPGDPEAAAEVAPAVSAEVLADRPVAVGTAVGARTADSARAGGGAAMLLIGHGSRSADGAGELRSFAAAVASAHPEVPVGAGYIEFMEPGLDEAIDRLVAGGACSIVAVPLVLLGAGHLKDDGPVALAAARRRHPRVHFAYGRDLGLHPVVLAAVEQQVRLACAELPGGTADAVVIVGRGSTDPDANADLAKAARLLADGRGLGAGLISESDPAATTPPLGLVLPAFVSLARPGVGSALSQCEALGARRIAVVPYFLFHGLLVDRITSQAAAWAAARPGHSVSVGRPMGGAPSLVELVWGRFEEALHGPVHMNCDGCLYRAPLPSYEQRVGAAPFGS
jgi:precorrin isomerase/sirohydrochlorin ferrochelatase